MIELAAVISGDISVRGGGIRLLEGQEDSLAEPASPSVLHRRDLAKPGNDIRAAVVVKSAIWNKSEIDDVISLERAEIISRMIKITSLLAVLIISAVAIGCGSDRPAQSEDSLRATAAAAQSDSSSSDRLAELLRSVAAEPPADLAERVLARVRLGPAGLPPRTDHTLYTSTPVARTTAYRPWRWHLSPVDDSTRQGRSVNPG